MQNPLNTVTGTLISGVIITVVLAGLIYLFG